MLTCSAPRTELPGLDWLATCFCGEGHFTYAKGDAADTDSRTPTLPETLSGNEPAKGLRASTVLLGLTGSSVHDGLAEHLVEDYDGAAQHI